MGIKKIARPINKTKNEFIAWLKYNNAENIDVYIGSTMNEWDYYIHVSAFIGNTLYSVVFAMYKGVIEISYSDGSNIYSGMSIYEFLQLIN